LAGRCWNREREVGDARPDAERKRCPRSGAHVPHMRGVCWAPHSSRPALQLPSGCLMPRVQRSCCMQNPMQKGTQVGGNSKPGSTIQKGRQLIVCFCIHVCFPRNLSIKTGSESSHRGAAQRREKSCPAAPIVHPVMRGSLLSSTDGNLGPFSTPIHLVSHVIWRDKARLVVPFRRVFSSALPG
jgi:hypothetical protein